MRGGDARERERERGGEGEGRERERRGREREREGGREKIRMNNIEYTPPGQKLELKMINDFLLVHTYETT